MRGNAHPTFKFIILIFVIIVTMQEQTQKGGGRNRRGMRRMSCVSCMRARFKSKNANASLPMHLPDEFNMGTREQSRSTSIASPEPIIVDIL